MHRTLLSQVSLLLLILAGGCAAVRELPSPPGHASSITLASRSPYEDFRLGIDTLLVDSLFPPSNAALKIVSLETGEVLYDLNSDLLFAPASNQKLFTSALALASLGRAFPLRTEFFADTSQRTLTIKGFGDPILSSREIDSAAAVCAPLMGGFLPWRVRADLSYFDSLGWGEGWSWDDEPAAYQMYISPLCLDQNAIEVTVQPAPIAGQPPLVSLLPQTSYVSVENTALTVLDTPLTSPPDISRRWQGGDNIVTVSGEFPKTARQKREYLSVVHPGLYCATVFADGLRRRGVTVGIVEADTLRPLSTRVFSLEHRLDSALTFMNKVSDNLSAEVLLKTVAAVRSGPPGTARGGITLLKEYLAGVGIDTVRMVAVDGSGLSHYNLTSASSIIRLLTRMTQDSSTFDAFYSSLPVAGVDGTISRRMRGTPAEGNLHAKTGHIAGVSSLSGYVRTADGELLAFSMLMQRYANGSERYRQVQNRIGAFLAGMKRENF